MPSQRNTDVSSAAAFEEALGNPRAAIEESSAEVIIGDLPVVVGQHWELVLVFQNLLGNAIEYSMPSERPSIAVRSTPDGKFWRFSVSDNGQGFSPDQAQSVFEPFTRLHSHACGTGLGLSICKRTIERRGSRIWAESRLSEGSAFYFTLRALETPSPEWCNNREPAAIHSMESGVGQILKLSKQKRSGNTMKLAGLVLIVLGLAALVWQGFSYKTQEKVADIGPIEVNKESTKRVPLSPYAGTAALIGGIALVAISAKK